MSDISRRFCWAKKFITNIKGNDLKVSKLICEYFAREKQILIRKKKIGFGSRKLIN